MDWDAEFWALVDWHRAHGHFTCQPLFTPYGSQLLKVGRRL